MDFPMKKFFSYYKPYVKLYLTVLACAIIVSGVTLVLPLLVRYITKNVLEGDLSIALPKVYWIGALMLVLVAIQNIANYFWTSKGMKLGLEWKVICVMNCSLICKSFPSAFSIKKKQVNLCPGLLMICCCFPSCIIMARKTISNT